MHNTIAVVLDAGSLELTKKDHRRKLTLVDPSSWTSDLEHGSVVNCYSTRLDANLPDVIQQGDIVLLHMIRVCRPPPLVFED